jgi:NurA domain
MLDRRKIMGELERISGSLFFDISDEIALAKKIWLQITSDSTFSYKVRQVKTDWLIPSWNDSLDMRYSIIPSCSNYWVYSIDGSQIYPDRHQGISCSLINVGIVKLHYGDSSSAQLESIPYVFTADESNEYDNAVDWVNCRRQEYEFSHALTFQPSLSSSTPSLLLFDGSLIFWHLNSENLEMHAEFLSSYLGSLYQLSQKKMLFASYISCSKSKELVNLLRLELSDFDPTNEAYKKIDHLVDTHIASFFLAPYERTTVFQNHATISASYPDLIKPYFFYLHNGYEIGRVEIPAWIAQDARKVDHVAQLILDQSIKGYGYPVAIAEAHEQAVIKGPDREFFYQLINQIGIKQKRSVRPSIKSMKKRRMGI